MGALTDKYVLFRKFLRLGNPLNCQKMVFSSYEAQVQSASTPVPLSRVKTLVSMTTPRSNNSNERTNEQSLTPFCEFDMSAEGFGCLFVPSLGSAGVNYSQDFVVQSASLLSSGIGEWDLYHHKLIVVHYLIARVV